METRWSMSTRSSRRSSKAETSQSADSKQVGDVASDAAQLPSPVSEPGHTVTPFFESTSERVKRRKLSTPATNDPIEETLAAKPEPRKRKRTPTARSVRASISIASRISEESNVESVNVKHEATSNQPATAPSPEATQLKYTFRREDEFFADHVVKELLEAEKGRPDTVGLRQTKRVLGLLQVAKLATQEEGPWLTEEQAIAIVKPGNLHTGPIFVSNQQPHGHVTVNDFLSEFYDDTAAIWIQDSAAPATEGTAREVPVRQVKERLAGPPTLYPWNCLELASPIEDGIRPKFLNGSECRLLTKIKIPPPRKKGKSASVGRRSLMPGYKEVEKWVLLAESGALTEPHQDSHGYNTYITINEGSVGFGWLHQPSTAERQQWMENPDSFQGGTWKYVVLRPGETVYFPAGTVHFVFRLRSAGHTLAFGGHVLRCSTIVPWAEALLLESRYPWIVNEDMMESVLNFLAQIEKFVLQAKTSNNDCEIDRWGGLDSIERFLKLKKTFINARRSR